VRASMMIRGERHKLVQSQDLLFISDNKCACLEDKKKSYLVTCFLDDWLDCQSACRASEQSIVYKLKDDVMDFVSFHVALVKASYFNCYLAHD
jgi:hypothetical protein